ncbi:hypothetical protein [Dactylosporangium sp. NPDC005555]|uniref:hypothetical protein n=1 Tax=Dactylosporangium sp. NPDC005555 TaxID=3154889 RepID=UPI0033AB12B9
MGALGLHIGFAGTPSDAGALLREVWDILADRMSRLADTSAGEEILSHYLHFQESDGFADGTWSAAADALLYSFGDAAGLCVVEMHACQHWASMTVLDRWPALTEAATRHGVDLTPPVAGDVEEALRSRLAGGAGEVFFHHFTDPGQERLGHTIATATPADDHELRFYALDESTRPLSATGGDRERITDLITTGVCACDICQNLRYFRGLPTARHQYE